MSESSTGGLYAVSSVLLALGDILFAGVCACLFYGEKLKVFGYSSYEIPKEDQVATLKQNNQIQLALNLLGIACLGLVKISALLFYKRIFCVSGRKAIFNIIVMTSVVVVVLWIVAFEFFVGFQCGTHYEAQWQGQVAQYCKLVWPSNQGLAISDFILDVWVLALPIIPVLKLQTAWSRKLAIIGIFLLGCTGVGASIARLYTFEKLWIAGKQAHFDIVDGERELSRLLFFMILEIGVGLIAVCLPSIWLVFASLAPEAILRSAHSLVSLASNGSKHSRDSQRRPKQAISLRSNASISSHIPISGTQVDSYELSSGRGHELVTIPGGQIHGNHSVHQSSASRKDEEA